MGQPVMEECELPPAQHSRPRRAANYSALLGERLLQGHRMLADCCPDCQVPLMQPRGSVSSSCVSCGQQFAVSSSNDSVSSESQPTESTPPPPPRAGLPNGHAEPQPACGNALAAFQSITAGAGIQLPPYPSLPRALPAAHEPQAHLPTAANGSLSQGLGLDDADLAAFERRQREMAAQRAASLAQIAAESAQQAGQSQHSLREQQALGSGDEDAADRAAHPDQAATAVGNSHASGLTGLQEPAPEAAPQERAPAAAAHQPPPTAVSQGAVVHSHPPSLPDPAEASQLLAMRRFTALQNRPAGTSVQLECSDPQTTPGEGGATGGSKHRPEDTSKEIAEKLVQGWKLLAQHCPRCLNPLVANRQQQILCPGCQLWVILEQPTAPSQEQGIPHQLQAVQWPNSSRSVQEQQPGRLIASASKRQFPGLGAAEEQPTERIAPSVPAKDLLNTPSKVSKAAEHGSPHSSLAIEIVAREAEQTVIRKIAQANELLEKLPVQELEKSRQLIALIGDCATTLKALRGL